MTPRVLFSRLPSLFVIPFLFSLAPAFSAQDTARKTQPQVAAPLAISASKKKDSSAAAKDRIAKKKALAVSLLVSLPHDARIYQHQQLRASSLYRIADAHW